MTLLHEQPTAEPLTPEQQLEQDILLVLQSALDHHHKGELDDAQALYQAILEARPNHTDVQYNLGVLHVQRKQPVEALPYLEAALGGAPDNGQFWVAYINALIDAEQIPAAWLALEMGQQRGLSGPAVNGLITRMAYDGAALPTTAVAPAVVPSVVVDSAETTETADAGSDDGKRAVIDTRRPSPQEINRFNALFNKGHLSQAIKLARELTERFPAHGLAWRSLGIALHRAGHYVEAIEPLRTAISLGSDDAEARNALADLLRLTSNHAAAEVECRTLLELNPSYSEGHRVLGLVLAARGRHREAIASCRRAVALTPEHPESHGTLGVVLLDLGASQEASPSFRRALELEPKNSLTRSNLLFCLAHDPDVDTEQIYAEHRKFARIHEAPMRATWPKHTNNRTPGRRLQVGIVSGDLFRHAVSSYLMPVMEPLAKDGSLTLHVYYNHVVEDDYTQRFRSHADQWNMIAGMTDEQFATKVRADKIDILIDMTGHTGRNRLQTFARKPAPIQVSWIGYPATTGLDAMDYYLSDRFFTPFGDIERQFSEKLVHLAAIGPFQPEKTAPPVNILPAMHNGYITFGSFNRLNKLRADVIAVWAKLLRELPTSRMVLGSMSGEEGDETLINWFVQEGISRDRLSFRPRSTLPVYLQQHFQVDICLDTFPYTGSTTVLNSLWMGVPTLTIAGQTMASRAAAAWLSHTGLEDFVAADTDEFVAKGVALASNIPALAALRTGLRERCRASAVFQPDVVAASLSQALHLMWQRWREGLAPAAFSADDSQTTGSDLAHTA
ncbi:tetratricopeptide repeat protein [Paraburkholderia metrosideri]|uniref:protein O-GlcNAc transferase n=1 Tax=Paraburkholderia metrosideri TaxID=580937 RepID=A0ABW9DPX2_9BURK